MVALTAPEYPQTLQQAIRHFDPDTARAYIASIKWPDGPVCPKCGSVNVGAIKSRNRCQCREKGCRIQFSLTTGTIFESTHLGLDQWLLGVWMIVNCKNGVSSCEIARAIGCKQQSAWHLVHRIRHIIQQAHTGLIGGNNGPVEADSTFVGGLMKFMSHKRQAKARASYLPKGKSTVHALKDRRSGTVRAKVLGRELASKIRAHVVENVAPHSRLYTDSNLKYHWAGNAQYFHEMVNHTYEYVRGTVHTNGLECFFNCLRMGIKGTYIRPTPDHLTAYVDEQVYRFNHRHDTDWERFDRAMRQVVGKRLTYKTLTSGATR